MCRTNFLHVILTVGSWHLVPTGDSASGASEPDGKSFLSRGEGTALSVGRGWIGWKAELPVRFREQLQSLASLGRLLPHQAHAIEQGVPVSQRQTE